MLGEIIGDSSTRNHSRKHSSLNIRNRWRREQNRQFIESMVNILLQDINQIANSKKIQHVTLQNVGEQEKKLQSRSSCHLPVSPSVCAASSAGTRSAPRTSALVSPLKVTRTVAVAGFPRPLTRTVSRSLTRWSSWCGTVRLCQSPSPRRHSTVTGASFSEPENSRATASGTVSWTVDELASTGSRLTIRSSEEAGSSRAAPNRGLTVPLGCGSSVEALSEAGSLLEPAGNGRNVMRLEKLSQQFIFISMRVVCREAQIQ